MGIAMDLVVTRIKSHEHVKKGRPSGALFYI